MNSNLVNILSLVIIYNCVIIVAKNSVEKVDEKSLNKTDERNTNSQLPSPEMFADGLGVSVSTTKSRIVGRKGVDMSELDNSLATSPNLTQLASSSTTSTTATTTTVSTTTPTTTTKTSKSKSTSSTSPKTTKSTITEKSTKKQILKPTITYSADDSADILANEKKINFNVTNKEVPKTSPDIDRTIIDEQRTRNSYVFFMGLLFGVPMTFTLIHVLYKKIKAWREIRHYQRVDFLIDGMYIS